MNRFVFIILLGIIVFLHITTGLTEASPQTVMVTGKVPLMATIEESRQAALQDAKRQAVEKGIGVWIKSETESDKNMIVRDQIFARTEGYLLDSEIIREGTENGFYVVVLQAKVSIDTIGADISKLVGQLKTMLGNPTIAFAITTYYQNQKYPIPTVVDTFQQEFREKRFDLRAAAKSREIAMAGSSEQIGFELTRDNVRKMAETEGANYAGVGEARLLDVRKSQATSNYRAAVQINVEILHVNSGDVVASRPNTYHASAKSEEEAVSQAFLSASIDTARYLAKQTIDTWQERANNGQLFTVKLRNVTSSRRQLNPFSAALEAGAQITSSKQEGGDATFTVLHKGTKEQLGKAIISYIDGNKLPGFSIQEFDGPEYEEGVLIFRFLI